MATVKISMEYGIQEREARYTNISIYTNLKHTCVGKV